MRIIKPVKSYINEISGLILVDLEKPNPVFPAEMISQFREHAKEENVANELDKPNLMAVLAVENKKLLGFIVGYKEGVSGAMIHCLTGDCSKTKLLLLNKFIEERKGRELADVKADTFEFMENNSLLKERGFVLIRKEKITNHLEMLRYKLDLNCDKGSGYVDKA